MFLRSGMCVGCLRRVRNGLTGDSVSLPLCLSLCLSAPAVQKHSFAVCCESDSPRSDHRRLPFVTLSHLVLSPAVRFIMVRHSCRSCVWTHRGLSLAS